MAKKLEYDISVDSSGGIKGLKQFSGAVRKEMKAIGDSADDASTNAQKLAKVLSGLAGDMKVELNQAAEAAEAMSRALGPELASRADVSSIIADLNRMGLSFEEITADADQLAAAVKQLDGVQLDAVNRGLSGVSSKTDDVARSADSSRSALANMIGNATQDVGALAGVSGSAGVAIGQMAEYMADAAGSGEKLGSVLKNFALVAGPIALIAAAIEVATGVMGEMAEEAAESDARVKAFGDAMADSANDAVGLAEALRVDSDALRKFNTHAGDFGGLFVENLGLVARQLPLIGGLIEESGADIVEIANKADISFYDLAAALEAGGLAGSEFNKHLLELADSGKITEQELEALLQFMDRYGAEVRDADEKQKLFNVDLEEADALFTEIVTKRAPLKRFTDQWDVLFEDLRDGKINAEGTAEAINYLADQLGVLPSEVISMALEEIDRRAEDATSSLETFLQALQQWAVDQHEAAQAAEEFAISTAEAQTSLDEMAGAFKTMERREGAIKGAFDLGNVGIETLGAITDINEAIRELGQFIRDEGVPDIFDPNDIDAGPFLDKIASLRDPIQQQIVNAFAAGGPEAAREVADGYVQQITESMRGRLTADQVRTLLGLGDLEATIRIAIDQTSLATAQASLDILMGKQGGKTGYTASIEMALLAGDITPEAAQVLINEALAGEGVLIPAGLDTPAVGPAAAEAQRFADNYKVTFPTATGPPTNVVKTRNDAQKAASQMPPILFPTGVRGVFMQDAGGTTPAGGGIAGERGPEILNGRYLITGPTYVPPGTRVTSRRRTERILRSRGHRGLRRYDNGGVVPHGPVTVNIRTGVIGNRYETMRAVKRATADALRLQGSRA